MKLIILLSSFIFIVGLTSVNAQCTTTNATSCACKDAGQTNCELLPDIIVARPPLLASGSGGVIEYSQFGNGANNGRLRISVSSPNVGHGPVEIRATNTYICGTDTLTGTAPTTCSNTGLPPTQLIKQRVYVKNGNIMTYYDRDAGSMTYHPTHGHMHFDGWGVFTLRVQTSDPNPLNWPVVGDGAKMAFCLMDYGSCSTYPGHCVDSLGNTLLNGNFPNYGLGGGSYNCSATVQGISSGYTDIYYQSLDGMWIDIPPGTCNGNYFIVAQLDPNNNLLEENENNNIIAIPYTLTKQAGSTPTITVAGSSIICTGQTVTLTSSPAQTYLWSNGATTQSIIVSQPGTFSVTTDPGSLCPATSNAITISEQPSVPASVSITSSSSGTIQSNTSVTFNASAVNAGNTPSYQWKKNGVNVGTNSSTYTNSSWLNGDIVQCVMTSSAACVVNSPATSNSITMIVQAAPVKFLTVDINANKGFYYDASLTFVSSSNLSTTVLNGVTNASDVAATNTHIYVLDGTNKRIFRSGQSGVPAVQSRTLLSNTGASLNTLTGITISNDSLWVIDQRGKAIYRYSLSAVYSGSGTINALQKVTMNSSNSKAEGIFQQGTFLYVIDNSSTKYIYRYNKSGSYSARSRALRTNTAGALNTVSGLAIENTDLWVTDRGLDRIFRYSLTNLYNGSTASLSAISSHLMNASNLDVTGIALVSTNTLLRDSDDNDLLSPAALEPTLKIFPNPTDQELNVTFNNLSPFSEATIMVVDMTGRVILRQILLPGETDGLLKYDVTNWRAGIYLLTIFQEQKSLQQKVIIE